jgi:hypothetical protein
MSWYARYAANPNDYQPLGAILRHFEHELTLAETELQCKGRIEEIAQRLPSIMAYRFQQLQEVDAILALLNLKLDEVRGMAHRDLMEKSNRVLTSRDAEKYAAADDGVFDIAMLVNEVALVRNKFLGVTKGLEILHYQLTNITKLRCAGLEDAAL